jgi:hypothetical protein
MTPDRDGGEVAARPTQRSHHVDAGGASGRNDAREGRDCGKRRRHQDQHQRIPRIFG